MKHYLWAIIPLLLAGCSKDNGSCADINAGWEFWSDKNQTRQVVDLPHDAMLTEARAADAPSGAASAFYLGGMYHYEKGNQCRSGFGRQPCNSSGRRCVHEVEGFCQ